VRNSVSIELADLIDPVRVFNNVDRGPFSRAKEAAFSSRRPTVADGRRDRLLVTEHSGRRCPVGSWSSSKSLGVCVGKRGSRNFDRERSCPSSPSTAGGPRVAAASRHGKGDLTGVRLRRMRVNTSTPREPAHRQKTSRTRRLLPIPGDPTTVTTTPWPSTARVPTSLQRADISHRPTDQIRLSTSDSRSFPHAQQPTGQAPGAVGTL